MGVHAIIALQSSVLFLLLLHDIRVTLLIQRQRLLTLLLPALQ